MNMTPQNSTNPSNSIENSSIFDPFNHVLTLIMMVLTLIGAFWAGLFPLRGNNDFWRHLKTGKVLWEHLQQNGFSFPEHDVFTYTGETITWINPEWLSELFIYGAYQLGGLQITIILKSLILALTFGLLMLYMRRRGAEWTMACLGTLIALLASGKHFFLQPSIFTLFFVVVFLHIILSLQQREHTKLAFIGAVVVQILWINLHDGAVFGIILIFFWWVSELWFCLAPPMLNNNQASTSFNRLRLSTVVLVAVCMASLVNPFTYYVHQLSFKVTSDWWLISHVSELRFPDIQLNKVFELIILCLFLLTFMGNRTVRIYEGLAVLFLTHLALNYYRYIPLFAVVVVPPFFSVLTEKRRLLLSLTPHEKSRGFWSTLYGWIHSGMQYHLDVILVFIMAAYLFGLRIDGIWYRNYQDFPVFVAEGYIKERYPEAAANFIAHQHGSGRLTGRMFNHDNFAGYLIWRLSPEKMKIFTDTRYYLWGSKYAKEEGGVFYAYEEPLGAYDTNNNWYKYSKADLRFFLNPERFPEFYKWYQSEKEYWRYILDKYNINFIVSFEGLPIDRKLRKEFNGWVLIFYGTKSYTKGDGYVIYVRDAPQNAEIIHERALIHRDHINENKEEP